MKKGIKVSEITFGDDNLKTLGNSRLGCFLEILECIKQQMDTMLSHHSKIIVVRLDLHVDAYCPDNELMSKFIMKIRKKLCAHFGLKRLGFIWVREQEKAKKQHYHIAIILDANKVFNTKNVIPIIQRIAEGWNLFLWVPRKMLLQDQKKRF